MKEAKLQQGARDALDRYLKANGMRRTPERYALLEKIFSMPDHFYIDVLCQAMELEGYHISRSTAYASMQLFLDAGLVSRHQFGNQPAQYERHLPGATSNHIHLVCATCGRVREVKDSRLTSDLTSRDYAGFLPASCQLYLYGECGRCRRMRKNSLRTGQGKPDQPAATTAVPPTKKKKHKPE